MRQIDASQYRESLVEAHGSVDFLVNLQVQALCRL